MPCGSATSQLAWSWDILVLGSTVYTGLRRRREENFKLQGDAICRVVVLQASWSGVGTSCCCVVPFTQVCAAGVKKI